MHRTHRILLTIFALCAIQAHAQLIFDPDVHDFGSIREIDGQVRYTFTGVNRGTKPLVLLDVVTSCGCTVPEFSRKPVVPGASTQITVTFDPANRPGVFDKELAVYSSEREKIATLSIRGSVVPRPKSLEERYPVDAGGGLRLSNTLSALTYIYQGKSASASIGYANTSSRTLSLDLRPLRRSGLLTIDAPQRIAPGEKGSITLTYRIPAEKPRYGTLDDALEVVVDNRSNGTLLTAHGIAVDDPTAASGKTAPKSQLSENMLKFGAVKRNSRPVRRQFTLSNEGDGELIVRAVESDGRIGTSLRAGRRIASGGSIPVEVTLDPARLDYGVMTDRLLIVTNDPQRPMRRLRVTAIIEPAR
ncbi:MAG: DUF1573 domain-containing protein [Alistipes sp.]|nr:DUF1573 domain-containing protein [Alistipes sp.]